MSTSAVFTEQIPKVMPAQLCFSPFPAGVCSTGVRSGRSQTAPGTPAARFQSVQIRTSGTARPEVTGDQSRL